jgi:superfamily II DNA or RNA helicase
MTRFEYAQSLVEKDYKHFLLDLVPRFGKSLVSIELVKKWNPERILILSGATSTNNQWLENIEKYNPTLLDKVDVLCYQSAHKIEDVYDCILLDEMDTVTQKRFGFISELNPKHWIGMSGTLEDEDIEYFRILVKGKFYHAKVTFNQAVEWGILPEPKIYAVALTMDNTKRYLVYHNSNDKKKKNVVVPYNERWNYLKDKTKNVLIQCTEVEYHELICQNFERWKGYEDEFNLPYEERSKTIQFMQTKGFNQSTCRDKKMRVGNDRKKFFADIKNRWFKKLFSQLPKDSRALVFCNDTKQADFLNEEFSVHSNKPGSLELVEEFNKGNIPYIFSNKMLDRGVDFLSVDYLVIIQSSMKQGGQIQKFARSGLSTAPKTILMYYPNTQDEKYVNEFLKGFKQEWIIRKSLM